MSIYLDVQEATRRPVWLEHGKQVGERVVGDEVVAIECGEDSIWPCKPESGFWSVMGSHWSV